jgi:hypothetical protein
MSKFILPSYCNRFSTKNPLLSMFMLEIPVPVIILLSGYAHKEEECLEDGADEVQRLCVVRTLGGHVNQQLQNKKGTGLNWKIFRQF